MTHAAGRARAALLALLLAGLPAAAPAGEKDAGGRAPSGFSDAIRPRSVVTREEIELSGFRNLRDLLESRRGLRFNAFGLGRPLVLGRGRAVILVNGRRVPDATFDLDSFPLSAVERVEALSGSAAALRGGRGAGGAINLVLRRGFEGFEARGSAALPEARGGDYGSGSLLWGSALGRGRAMIGLDLFRREEIRDADRDYSRASWTPGGAFAEARGVSTRGNTLVLRRGGAALARPLGACEGSAYVPGLRDPLGIPGEGCGFAYSEIDWRWERMEREGLFLSAEHPIGAGASLWLEARAARRETGERFSPAFDSVSFAPPEALRESLLARHPDLAGGDLESVTVHHRFVGHGSRNWITDLDEADAAIGVRGRWGSVGYGARAGWYRYDEVVRGGTFVSRSGARRAIEEGRYDVENPLSTDPVHLAAVRETSLRLRLDHETERASAGLALEGAALALPGGEVRWRGGVEAASEEWRYVRRYRDARGRARDPGDVRGASGASADGERERLSAFAEVVLPLLPGWEVSLAGRRDERDDAGGTLSREVAARWRPTEALALRASWGAGGAAPDLRAMGQHETRSEASVCAPRPGGGCERTRALHVDGGNPRLAPDEAESVSLGAEARLAPFSFSLDWFRVGVSRAPARLSPQEIVDLDAAGRLPAGLRVAREGGAIRRIEGSWGGVGEINLRGLDARAGASWKTAAADFRLSLRWLRVGERETRAAGRERPAAYPRDRAHASLRASRGRFTANWSVYAASGYENAARTARYGGWTGHDLTLRWRGAFGVRGLELLGGVLNAGDRGPSRLPGGASPDATLASSLGRALFLSAKMTLGP